MKKKRFFLGPFLFLLAMLVSFWASSATDVKYRALPSHAIYISICEIAYEDQQLNISIKVFTDDLEDAIRNQTGEIIAVEGKLQNPETHRHIANYLTKQVSVLLDGSTRQLHYVDSHKENDATWVNFTIEKLPSFSQLKVVNQTFTELFDTQMNVVTFTNGGEKQYLRLGKNEVEGVFEVD